MPFVLAILLLLAVAACAPSAGGAAAGADAAPDDVADALRCNGHATLCDRRLDEVALATTHNAMASEERGYLGANQRRAIPTQLLDGVRGLMLDVHDWEGGTWLCHGDCRFGRQPLAEGLAEAAAFLAGHPREVLVVTFESYVSAAALRCGFSEGGLLDHVHAAEDGAP